MTSLLRSCIAALNAGPGLRREVNEFLRTGLAAVSQASSNVAEPFELPTFDPGRALINRPPRAEGPAR